MSPSSTRASTAAAAVLLVLTCSAPAAWAAEASGHGDPAAVVALWVAVILVVAKIGGHFAVHWGQPAVLGELVGGIVLGNLSLAGVSFFEPIESDSSVDMLSRLGVLILLFEVGLESTIAQMLEVGLSSLLVAVTGVVAPFALGWAVGAWLLPEHSAYMHAFLGATLCATSVGITARVLQDLGRSRTTEARIILGAAVIDDVLGLVVLAAVTGMIAAAEAGGTISYGSVGLILLKAVVFLVASLAIGLVLAPRILGAAARLKAHGVLLAFGVSFCFFLSWIANEIGLAPIVGAFAAGLILEPLHYRPFTERGEQSLEHLLEPVSAFLVPVFFVVMGMHTDLAAFAKTDVLVLAGALTIAAVIGKQACSAGVVGRAIDRISVGVGMVPRGEVGLIFANIGLSLTLHGERIVDSATYSAVVVMVVATTMLTPPALKWTLARGERAAKGRAVSE